MSYNDPEAIIVVGGGLSGGSAALTILEGGRRVILVEKMKKLGGNSVRASSGLNASETHHQKAQGVEDPNSLFMHDTIFSATKNLEAKPYDLIQTLCKNSADGVRWVEAHGLEIPVLSQCGGHSAARTHRPTTGAAGGYITLGLLRHVKKFAKQKQATIIKKAKMTSLIRDPNSGRVVGLKYTHTQTGKEEEVRGAAVVIATGGFCHNREMIREFSPSNVHVGTTNGPWTQGEGMMCARDIGAKLIHMQHVQVHPTGFIDPKDPDAREKTLAAECLRAAGALLINEKGHRFTNELGHRDDVTAAERSQPGKIRLVLNTVAIEEGNVGPHVKMYTNFFKVLKPFKDSYALAEEMGIDAQELIETYNDYNRSAKRGWCPSGKPRFPGTPYEATQELRVGFVEPVLHYVMGGVAHNTEAEALDTEGKVIPGLYVCGETAGGVHGKNRLAGNSLVECVVYGRVAGQSCLKMMNKGMVRAKL